MERSTLSPQRVDLAAQSGSSRMTWTDPYSDSRSRLALLAQSTRECALFLDVDGTLLDIAETPDLARVPPSLIADLERVCGALEGALALVSGRAIKWIDRSFRPLRLPVAGQQGAEIRPVANGPVLTRASADLGEVRARLRPLHGLEGIDVEDKGLSIAVHYRRAHDRAAAAKMLIANALADLGEDLEVLRGRLVYEVKARAVNKGTAVSEIADTVPFSGRMPVYFGDDRTDEYGFREARARGGIAVHVGPTQAPPGSLWIEGPGETRRWLAGAFTRSSERACA